jgi:hypothetical protein
LTASLQSADRDRISAAVAEIAENRAVIEQVKGMLILLYGFDDESAFGLLWELSQNTNIKLRALAEQLVSDCRALSNGEALPPRSVYEKTLTTVHERITATDSDLPIVSLSGTRHRPPKSPHWQAPKRFGNSSQGNRQAG